MDFELSDIQFLGFFIILNRFIYFLFNYNLITALYIVFISTISCILWFNFFFINSKYFFRDAKGLGKTPKMQSFNLLKKIDSKMDRFIKSILHIFFKKKKKLKFLNTFWEDIRTILTYYLFIFIGKKHLPHFIKWNWSLIIYLKILSKFTCILYRRAYYYKFKVLKYTDKSIEEFFTNIILITIIFFNFYISLLGFINSALGQFTIIPLFKRFTSLTPKNILHETNSTILKLLKIENI
uniref:Uncharacterized protein n=1 Tax=Nitzschia sp. (in: diatoms) TaxID=1884248 RepID=A0A5J6DV21_9STRA|nr:hypothetical protein [Nitzschia sp. (in: diatoms)]